MYFKAPITALAFSLPLFTLVAAVPTPNAPPPPPPGPEYMVSDEERGGMDILGMHAEGYHHNHPYLHECNGDPGDEQKKLLAFKTIASSILDFHPGGGVDWNHGQWKLVHLGKDKKDKKFMILKGEKGLCLKCRAKHERFYHGSSPFATLNSEEEYICDQKVKC